ncbi:MAG TPA: hypothetical protein VK891_04550 [Euzebyales bacterium]|nr:hypothetical protein [Euzebyales bacterium]
MYTSTEDARSDLFLSGAVYVVGPAVVGILTDLLRVDGIPLVVAVLAVVTPIVTTALVPFLLMRYRGESLGQYGYGAGLPPNFGIGLLLAAPIVVAAVIAGIVVGEPLSALGVMQIIDPGGEPYAVPLAVGRILNWLGLGFLAVYATVKARDAFRSDFRTVRDETIWLGKILAAVAAVAVSIALLLMLPGAPGLVGAGLTLLPILLLPLGVAGSIVLLLRTLRGPSATSRATMLTPVVLLAVGPFQLSFSGTSLALSVWSASLYAGVGLMIAALQESRRSALACFGLTLAIALLTPL